VTVKSFLLEIPSLSVTVSSNVSSASASTFGVPKVAIAWLALVMSTLNEPEACFQLYSTMEPSESLLLLPSSVAEEFSLTSISAPTAAIGAIFVTATAWEEVVDSSPLEGLRPKLVRKI